MVTYYHNLPGNAAPPRTQPGPARGDRCERRDKEERGRRCEGEVKDGGKDHDFVNGTPLQTPVFPRFWQSPPPHKPLPAPAPESRVTFQVYGLSRASCVVVIEQLLY